VNDEVTRLTSGSRGIAGGGQVAAWRCCYSQASASATSLATKSHIGGRSPARRPKFGIANATLTRLLSQLPRGCTSLSRLGGKTDDSRVLIGHRAANFFPGIWTTPSSFVSELCLATSISGDHWLGPSSQRINGLQVLTR